ncbi:hypothetical protein VSDG_08139 [Cytospora chrysosperma]|uniref:Hemerythrin-like domain-containing protein n=1 Tax=Cytospora chrysosperma TaxID=252740 RepID=A0A423VH28_CYTCH|nr:hypothetical protein VSDG_08139 [Valsa sordida]
MSTAAEQTKGDGIAPVEGLEAGEATACPKKTGAAEPEASVCKDAESKPERALPPLSAHEFKQYNRLAEHMNYFHEHFRQSWNLLYQAASSGQVPAGMSPRQYMDAGLQFISHLAAHHSIEESYIFPVLARRMPEGMDAMEEYLRRCRGGEAELDMAVLRAVMDTWGAVLWRHLDQEVEALAAENVRRYFTVEEVRRIPM